MDKKKIIIILVVVAVIAVGAFIFFRKRKKQQQQETTVQPLVSDSMFDVQTTSNPSSSSYSSGGTYTKESFPIDVYMKGDNVKKLQQMVGVSADGMLGPKTKDALVKAGVKFPISKDAFNRITDKKNWKNNTYTGLNGFEDLMS